MRSSIEIPKELRRAIKLIAARQDMKSKDVAEYLIRYGLNHAKAIFPDKHKRHPDNGK